MIVLGFGLSSYVSLLTSFYFQLFQVLNEILKWLKLKVRLPKGLQVLFNVLDHQS